MFSVSNCNWPISSTKLGNSVGESTAIFLACSCDALCRMGWLDRMDSTRIISCIAPNASCKPRGRLSFTNPSVMDGNGIGLGVYQDLKNTGMRHLVHGDAMGKVNAANLNSDRFRRGLINLYDGRVRIPTSMPGLEILLGEFAAF